jgi:hypothetical protein
LDLQLKSEKENFNKKYDILYCAVCGNNLGIDLTKFKEFISDLPFRIEKQNISTISSYVNSLPKYFVLKNRIVIKNSKCLKIGLCGLKLDKIVEIETSFNEIIKREKEKDDFVKGRNTVKIKEKEEEIFNQKVFNDDNIVNQASKNIKDNILSHNEIDKILSIKNIENQKLPINSYPTIEFVLLKQVINYQKFNPISLNKTFFLNF